MEKPVARNISHVGSKIYGVKLALANFQCSWRNYIGHWERTVTKPRSVIDLTGSTTLQTRFACVCNIGTTIVSATSCCLIDLRLDL